MKDWNGNKKSTYALLGASNHAILEREQNDYYATVSSNTTFHLRMKLLL